MKRIEFRRSPSNPSYPGFVFDADSGVCEISGESYMEEAYKFYYPLINWLKEFTEKENGKIILNIKLIYFNTSTTKCLLDMFEILKKYKNNGNEVEINWFYDKEDPDMIDEVKDFEKEAEIDIEVKEF